MSNKIKVLLAGGISFIGLLLIYLALTTNDIAVLDPKGVIASEQKELIVFATLLMLLIVLPVFALTFFISWRYREGNTRARYDPDLHGNRVLETIWWGFPVLIISVLSVVIWQSSHELDPKKSIVSAQAPLEVQVVALQWKWLFIYPQQNIATVNYLNIPVNTPIRFTLTSDAPMNSFWVPQLGGQIYAMPGMSTSLHLNATEEGSYAGSSANLSGEGFAGMRFTVDALSNSRFETWLSATKNASTDLTNSEYAKLSKPSTNTPRTTYGSYQSDLYDSIVEKYMSDEVNSKTETQHDH